MTRRSLALALVGLLAACTMDTSTDESSADDVASGDDGRVVIDEFGDIPAECREIMAEFLADIEPSVEQLDWDTATLDDIQGITPAIDQMTIKFDTNMEATGCDDFAFGADTEQRFEFAIEIARQEAPGSEPWLRFSRAMSTGPDTVADGSLDPSSLPADCDEATTAVADLMGDADSMLELPVADLIRITEGVLAIDAVCSPEQAEAFLDTDPRLQELFGGG